MLISPREYEVLKLSAQGLTNTEVSDKLDIKPQTVKNHITSILKKLGVRNKIEIFISLGWLKMDG